MLYLACCCVCLFPGRWRVLCLFQPHPLGGMRGIASVQGHHCTVCLQPNPLLQDLCGMCGLGSGYFGGLLGTLASARWLHSCRAKGMLARVWFTSGLLAWA